MLLNRQILGLETSLIAGCDGTNLVVDHWPNPTAPALVLLHGGGQTRYAWGEAGSQLFACGYDVWSLDLRGHGQSDWSTAGNYSLDAFRTDLAILLALIGKPVILIGASLGGLASLLLVGECPEADVRGLVLVDITPTMRPNGSSRIQAFMRANLQGFGSVEEAADAVAAFQEHRKRPADVSGLLKNLRLRDGRLYWHWDPAFLDARTDDPTEQARLMAAASNIDIPLLLVRGEKSEIVSAQEVATLCKIAPQTEVVEVIGARHMVAGDQNTTFGEAMMPFLARVCSETTSTR